MPFLKDHTFKETHSQRLERISRINGWRHAIVSIGKDTYKGQWKDNIKCGKGQYLTRSFRLYEGDWDRNYRHGFGVFARQDEKKVFRMIYRGDWKNGKYSGEGRLFYEDGSVYEGFFRNGKRHGFGKMWFADGAYYEGDWIKDKKHGKGMFVYVNGNRFEGEFKDDMKWGKGRFYHLDSGQLQEGVWREDICIYSTIIDIPFRQSSSDPTYNPIKEVELLHPDEVCIVTEARALEGLSEECISIVESISDLHQDSKLQTNVTAIMNTTIRKSDLDESMLSFFGEEEEL